MSSTPHTSDRSVSRRLRYPIAVLLAIALALASTPALSADEHEDRPQPEPESFDTSTEWDSTDPSAEEAAGRLGEEHRHRAEELDPGVLADPEVTEEPDDIVVDGGMTQPVFSYEDAIRETVEIPGAVSSQDGDETDVLTVDIIRPAASEGDLDVPTIIVPSPYYQSPGRGRAGETKPAPNGPIDFFPLYYDNYFVPRGYAVALLDLAGTRDSTGCLDIGGPAEIENTAKLVEWLNGSGVAHDADGDEVDADWSNGLSSMVGKSWDGTVANGVASLGTEGLATIVPITAISSWHKYYWHNGAEYFGSPAGLAFQISNVPFNDCTDVFDELLAGGPDPDPESEFWAERDYIPDADNVEASVFVVHGLNDYNVKPNNYGEWWEALAEHDVPRKIWLSQVAHEKAFDFRRDEWLVTINRWFDHWLHEVDNGIMDEPMADVEHAPDQWASYDTWPGGTHTNLRLGQPEDGEDPRPGALSLNRRNLDPASQTFTETRQHHNSAAQDGFDDRDDRLVFMTDELNDAVRISGTSMEVSLRASIDGPDASVSAYLVDYGEAERTDWPSSGGIRDLDTVSCFGQGTEADDGCYRDVERRTRTRDYEVVARGWANASFITGQDAFDPDESYRLTWDIMADDYTFEAGHRIGVVITGVDSSAVAFTGTSSDVEVHLNGSHVHLPVVGGARALRNATR